MRYNPGMNCDLDHLVVLAASLEQGAAWCQATLGVLPGPGGRHALMGTHNRLLRINGADFEQAYLEIIAIDPAAPPPGRPRWFGLDDAAEQARLRRDGPRLAHAVLRTADVDTLREGLVALGSQPGPLLSLSRETAGGRLSWRMLVRDDGAIDLAGHLPTLIQWQGPHPTAAMPPSALRLRAAALGGLPAPVRQLLQLRGVTGHGDGPAVTVTLDTPRGTLSLRSDP